MDIQLFATDEELREFPESKTDSSTALDKTPSPKDINLMASDLPRSHTDLPKSPSKLPDRKSKCKSRRSRRHKSRSKNCTSGYSVIQVNDPLDSIKEKWWIVQTTPQAYLDQLVESFSQSAHGQSACSRSASDSSSCGQSAQSSHPSTVVPPTPARLECTCSNPLTPGTPVCPPRHPDWQEPIKLSYNG